MLSRAEQYQVAHGVMVLLGAWIPSVVLFFCTLCAVRRRKDPARTAFTYLKLALLVFSGFAFLDVCGYGLSIASSRVLEERDYYYYGDTYNYDDVVRVLQIAMRVVESVAQLYDMITDILVMIILLRISTGIVIAQSGHAGPIGKILRLGSYAIAVLLAALALAGFGLRIRFVYELFYGDRYDGADSFEKSRQVIFSFSVLIFIISLGIVARAIMVKMQPKAEKTLSWCSTMLIATSVVWLLRTTFNMAAQAAWSNLSDVYDDPEWKNYYHVLDVIFAIWPQFIVLCMVYAIGSARNNGIWSTPQPFLAPQGNQQTPWGYSYNGAQPPTAGPPMAQQQQQQQQPYQPEQQYQQHPQQQMPQGWNPHQQHQGFYAPQQQGYPQQQQYAPYGPVSPISNTRSPPPHEETLGLNHQADGTPPQVTPQPYAEKQAI
ncbi:hypothetical protein FSARC_213 [Fusarium sarcochroum]|uniref:Uncharacterized protein n=1 Tax=Fusarium sarcochroum TaxID=1208366 RepID=A0A8H4XGM4_9HYPO|nr:hypothetical protein FSARC_213 [Fusarium sarcochroum]